MAASASAGCACWLNWCWRVLISSHTAQYSTCRAAQGDYVLRMPNMKLRAALLCATAAGADSGEACGEHQGSFVVQKRGVHLVQLREFTQVIQSPLEQLLLCQARGRV